VIHGRDVAIGPGKADLLEGVARAGSITAAANQLGMSYMRAWLLLKLMNQKFKEPVVRTARGGRRGGSASLTSTGRAALRLYRALEDETAILAGRFRRSFLRLLRP
jgi:molybdate transport system regulatory protein